MNKVLTISIAAYNVEKFIENALESLLIDEMEEIEVLVQDDGGNDKTGEIVKKYEKKYPNIVKLVHKENGGYGSTINSSIKLAKGKYFKQLDGDDWFEKDNLKKIIKILKNTNTDVVFTPYIEYYEKNKKTKLIDGFSNDYNGEYNTDDVLLKIPRYLNMYTITYKTEILKEHNIRLLENCFYTDTEYAIYPMAYCNTIYITHIPIYMYRIGRIGQSIGLDSRIKYYEDHIKVSKRLVSFFNKIKKSLTPNKVQYLQKYIGYMVAGSIGNFLILLPCNKENLQKIKDFENYIYDNNKELYFDIEKKSRLIKLLRKTNYKLYRILSFYKRQKFK